MSVQQEKLKAIADAIREKDGTTEPISADDFPERIRAIEAVPEPTVEERLYPYAVYRATRPTDWPEMPEPGENEICIYVRRDVIESDAAVNFLCWLKFTGNGVLEVSYSRTPKWVEDGVPSEVSGWAWDGQKLSRTVEQGSPQSWGATDTDFEGDDNIIRFQFKGTLDAVSMDSSQSSDGVCEIWCNLPSNISLAMAKSSTSCYAPNIRYFKHTGTVKKSTNFAFSQCHKLIAVLEYPNIEAVSFGNSAFRGCSNLEAIPPIIWKGIEGRKNNMNNVFMDAIKLKHCPIYGYNLQALTNSYTFEGCSNLQSIPQWILDKTTSSLTAFLKGCTGIKELKLHRNTSFPSDTFSELEILTFNPDSPITSSLTVNIPKIGYLNFKTMLLSLPLNTATDDAKKTFTVTLSEETKAQVTDDDYAICTEKGWILTIT